METRAFDLTNDCWSGEQAMKGGHLLFLPSDLSLKCGANGGGDGSFTVVLPDGAVGGDGGGSSLAVNGRSKSDFYFVLDRDGVSDNATGFDGLGEGGDFGKFEPVVDCGRQAQNQQKTVNGVAKQVDVKVSEQLEPKLLKTRSGRVCRLSKKVEENLDSAKVVKKVAKVPVSCKKCNESFAGLKSLWRHLIQFPDHGSLPDNGLVLEQILNPPDKKKPAKAAAKGKKKAVGKNQTTPTVEAPPAAPCPTSQQDEDVGSTVAFKDGSIGVVKPKEELDLWEDVEALKQAFLKKCDEFSLGELFIVRTESKADDGEPLASLATPHGRRFLAMLKDLERLVDALKYAAELSFVLEESDLTEGVLKVEGTLSDILAIAEGMYKPVCDVKEIMVLVREKLKPDSDQRQHRFNSSSQPQPQKKQPETTTGNSSTETQAGSKKEAATLKVVVKRKKKVVKIKKVVKPSVVVEKERKQVANPVSTASTSTVDLGQPIPAVTSAPTSRPLQLTIHAVVQGMEEVTSVVSSASSTSLPPSSVFEDHAMQEHPTVMSIESDVHDDLHRFMSAGEDSNVPTESLSPSLKVVDDSVTKDAMTILSEDINEASNSSDIGSVLIPVAEKNVSSTSNLLTSTLVEPFTSTFGTITVERRPSMDNHLPPSVPVSISVSVGEPRREKKKSNQMKRSYSSSKSIKAKKPKESVITSVAVSTPSNDEIQVLKILPPSNRPFGNVSSFSQQMTSSRQQQQPVYVHHEPFLNPNSLPRTCSSSTVPSSTSGSNGHFMPPPSPDASSTIARRLDFTMSVENGTSNGVLQRPKRPVSRMSPPVKLPPSSCTVCASSNQQPTSTAQQCVQNLQQLQQQHQQQNRPRNGYHLAPPHPPPPYSAYNGSKAPVPPPYPLIGSPDKLSALPSHMISSYPKYRVASASSGSLCTVVDSTRRAISPGLSIRLPSSPIPQPGPLPSPSRMSLRSPHGQPHRLRQANTDEDLVESELEDSDREADHHGIDSDLESVTNAFVEGRLVARPPDAHSENSNSSVVDFEQLIRDIDIPFDINYCPRALPVSSAQSPAPSPSPLPSSRTALLFRPHQSLSPSVAIPFTLQSGVNVCHRGDHHQHPIIPNPSLPSSAMSM